MVHKAIVAVSWVLLLALIGALVAAASWFVRPVDTGVGLMSRFDVGRVYFRLAASQPRPCQQAYLVGVSGGFALAPANAIEEAALGMIQWVEVPRRVGSLFGDYLDGLFHNPPPYKCGIPRPRDWTIGLVNP